MGTVVAAGLLATSVFAMELPAPPAGFDWKEVPEIKAAFLVPKGWHFKRETQADTLALFITQEDIRESGAFATGLTINVFPRSKPGSATEYAQAFITQMATEKHADRTWARDAGPLRTFGCLTRDSTRSGTVILHTLMVANPKTGTLYLFIFEAPERTWADAWAKGEKIMDLLAIDDEV
jgi:hypothetical protein